MIVAPEALAAFFALVGLLTCDQTGLVKTLTRNAVNRKQEQLERPQKPYPSGSSGAWSGGRGG